MSSPPTSKTSTKVGQLSQPRRRFHLRSSSFAAINPFRKKQTPIAYEPAEPNEPYEVASGTGILNTDYTAKVFGYLDKKPEKWRQKAEKKRAKEKRLSEGAPRSQPTSPVKKLVGKYKEVHKDDGTDDFRQKTHQKHREEQASLRQEKRDEACQKIEERARRERRGRMVTTSKEDEILSRAANPRTGIVSPWVMSQINSQESGYESDYMNAHKNMGPLKNQGTWKQTSRGWSLIEDPPPDEAVYRPTPRISKPSDELIMNVPQDPSPGTSNEEIDGKIARYQRSLRRAKRVAYGKVPFKDVDAPPTPREWTPLGLSSPPRRLNRIKRKEVGSGVSQREASTGTVVHGHRASVSTMPIMRSRSKERHKVRLLTPGGSLRGVTKGISHSHINNSKSFLGRHPWMMATIQNTSPLAANARGDLRFQTGDRETSTNPTALPQCMQKSNLEELPPLEPPGIYCSMSPTTNLQRFVLNRNFLHQFPCSSLSRGYRRPQNLMLPYLKWTLHDQAAKDALTTTTTTTTTISETSETSQNLAQRPKPERQLGLDLVPEVSHHRTDCPSFKRRVLDERATETTATIDKENATVNQSLLDCLHSSVQKTLHFIAKRLKSTIDLNRESFTNTISKTMTLGDKYSGWAFTDTSLLPYPVTRDSQYCTIHHVHQTQPPATSVQDPFRLSLHPDTNRPHLHPHPSKEGLSASLRGTTAGYTGALNRCGNGSIPIIDGLPSSSHETHPRVGELRKRSSTYSNRKNAEDRLARRHVLTSSEPAWNWFLSHLTSTAKERSKHSGTRLTRQNPLLRRTTEVRELWGASLREMRPPTCEMVRIMGKGAGRVLVLMVCHVLVALHPDGEAIGVLKGCAMREKEGRGGEKKPRRNVKVEGEISWKACGRAVRDVGLALVYVVILVKLGAILVRGGRVVAGVVERGKDFLRVARWVLS